MKHVLVLALALVACNAQLVADAGTDGGCTVDRPTPCGILCCNLQESCKRNGGVDECCDAGVACGPNCCTAAAPFCGTNQSCCASDRYCNGACCIGTTVCGFNDAGMLGCFL